MGRKNDFVTSLLWNPFSTSSFFAGTSTGVLMKFELHLDGLVRCSLVWQLQLPFWIDMIALDAASGDTAAAASRAGRIAIVRSANEHNPIWDSKPVELSGKSLTLNGCIFFPSNPDFLILITSSDVLLYSHPDGQAVPFLSLTNIQKIAFLSDRGNRALVVRAKSAELWEFGESGKTKLSEINFTSPPQRSVHEMVLCDIRNNQVVAVTRNWWLNTIAIRKDRLFLVRRVRMLDSRPIDWSFANGIMAFSMKTGYVLMTGGYRMRKRGGDLAPDIAPQHPALPDSPLIAFADAPVVPAVPSVRIVPAAPAVPAAPVAPSVPVASAAPAVSKPRGRLARSSTVRLAVAPTVEKTPSNDGDMPAPSVVSQSGRRQSRKTAIAAGVSSTRMPLLRVAPPARGLRRSRSLPDIRSDDDLLREIASEKLSSVAKEADAPASPAKQTPHAAPKFGTICSLGLCFRVCSAPLDRIEWIGPYRLITWTTRPTIHDRSIFLIDLRMRRTRPLLGNLSGMSISAVVLSDNRKYLAVVVGGFIVTFFTTAVVPRQLGSFTFSAPATVTFRLAPDAAVIVLQTGQVMVTNDLREHSMRLSEGSKLHFPGQLTAAIVRHGMLYLGTSLGLFRSAIEGGRIEEVKPVKFPIGRIDGCPRENMLVYGDRGRVVFCSDTRDFYPIRLSVHNAVMYNPFAFLIRIVGESCVRVFQIIGKSLPSPPPCASRCPVLRSRAGWSRALAAETDDPDVAIKYGMTLLARIRGGCPEWTVQQLVLLYGLLKDQHVMLERTFRTALLLGLFDAARSIVTAGPQESPNFAMNMMKCAAFSSRTRRGDTPVIEAATGLFRAGFVADAVDVLLITQNWEFAVQLLLKAENFRIAQLVCRAQHDSPDKRKFMKQISEVLWKAGNYGHSLLMLADCGDISSLKARLWELNEPEQANLCGPRE
jgi:hypothetical protein